MTEQIVYKYLLKHHTNCASIRGYRATGSLRLGRMIKLKFAKLNPSPFTLKIFAFYSASCHQLLHIFCPYSIFSHKI